MRESDINKLIWIPGSSRGHSGPLNELWRATRGIKPDEEQIHSIVIIDGVPDQFSDDELRQLAEFSDRILARHDANWTHRNNSNFIIFRKHSEADGGGWTRKQASWWQDTTSPTLEEAIAVMDEATPIGSH